MPTLRSALPALALATLAFTSTAAHAWDWDEENGMREWRNESLDWAQDIAYDELGESYTHAELETSFNPPPREAWCVENPAPTPQDCQVLDTRVRSWLRRFLDLPSAAPLPPGLPIMPAECSSICSN